jgi:hypothetical protein
VIGLWPRQDWTLPSAFGHRCRERRGLGSQPDPGGGTLPDSIGTLFSGPVALTWRGRAALVRTGLWLSPVMVEQTRPFLKIPLYIVFGLNRTLLEGESDRSIAGPLALGAWAQEDRTQGHRVRSCLCVTLRCYAMHLHGNHTAWHFISS